MELADYRRTDDDSTIRLEREALVICKLMQSTVNPSADDLTRVRQFLEDVEMWKADCKPQATGRAVQNDPKDIWDSLREAVAATDDLGALLSIMNLVGFGSHRHPQTGQGVAKRATAVLRFLDPDGWGTVDWRTAAMLAFYKNSQSNIEMALNEARNNNKRDVAELYNYIDQNAALYYVEQYRGMRNKRLPRTVDVELALYGASFAAWP